jgi:hypothetical protein
MAKLTKDQKRMRKAVRRLNVCLDVEAVRRTLNQKDDKEISDLITDAELALTVPDGKFTFAVNNGDGTSWVDCTPRPRDVKRAYPEGTPQERLKVFDDHDSQNVQDINRLRDELEEVRAKLTDYLVIMTGMAEEEKRKFDLESAAAGHLPRPLPAAFKLMGHFERLFSGITVNRTQLPVEGESGRPQDSIQEVKDVNWAG